MSEEGKLSFRMRKRHFFWSNNEGLFKPSTTSVFCQLHYPWRGKPFRNFWEALSPTHRQRPVQMLCFFDVAFVRIIVLSSNALFTPRLRESHEHGPWRCRLYSSFCQQPPWSKAPCRLESLCLNFTNEPSIFVDRDLVESIKRSASDRLGDLVP